MEYPFRIYYVLLVPFFFFKLAKNGTGNEVFVEHVDQEYIQSKSYPPVDSHFCKVPCLMLLLILLYVFSQQFII